MLNLLCSSAYSSWFQRMSSPRCRIVGFDTSILDVGEGEAWERFEGMVVGGAGRPESWGVGVEVDILSFLSFLWSRISERMVMVWENAEKRNILYADVDGLCKNTRCGESKITDSSWGKNRFFLPLDTRSFVCVCVIPTQERLPYKIRSRR
jgi:hypothetical protein